MPLELSPSPNRQNENQDRRSSCHAAKTARPKQVANILIARSMRLTKPHIVPQRVSVIGQYYQTTYCLSMWRHGIELGLWQVMSTSQRRSSSRAVAAHGFSRTAPRPVQRISSQTWCRRCLEATRWLKDNWPGTSPDLNMIETLLAILKDAVYQYLQARTTDELRQRVRLEWKRNPQDLLQKFAESFIKRVEGVIASEGRKIVG